MKLNRTLTRRVLPIVGISGLLLAGLLTGARRSSHREAPLIAEDPVADLTDVYAFVSPDKPDTVTLVANVNPFELPAGGPNFHKFGDDVLYQINVDNDGDAVADLAVPVQVPHDHDATRTRSCTTRTRSRRSTTPT